MSDGRDWSAGVIAEFGANGGKVGSEFDDAGTPVPTSTGVSLGSVRTTPPGYHAVAGRPYVVKRVVLRGAAKNYVPFHILVAHPQATIEVGTDRFPVTAGVAVGLAQTLARSMVVASLSVQPRQQLGCLSDEAANRIPFVELTRRVC
ncbi:MAG TPA: nitroreductase/quinone reductase family protein, partial [Thermomicrobiales bacterium]|nr:nitroreductase/quinone reductase family protein [Thermomicrobiales bacterium]